MLNPVTEMPVSSTPISTIKLPVLVAIKRGVPFRKRFKFNVVGNECAGKTVFTDSTCGRLLTNCVIATCGLNLGCCNINTMLGEAKFELWDTGGAERFRALTHGYYRGSHGVFVMANSRYLEPIKFWLEDVQMHLPDLECFTILYDGKDIQLKSYTPENLSEALNNNAIPPDLGKAGLVLLTQASDLLLTPKPEITEDNLGLSATTPLRITATSTENMSSGSVSVTNSFSGVFNSIATLFRKRDAPANLDLPVVASPAIAATTAKAKPVESVPLFNSFVGIFIGFTTSSGKKDAPVTEASDSSFSALVSQSPDSFFAPPSSGRIRPLLAKPGDFELVIN